MYTLRVCIYMYKYTYAQTHIYAYICTCTCTRIHEHTHIHIHVHAHIYTNRKSIQKSLGCTPVLPLPKNVRLWGVHRHRTGWRLVGVPF